MTCQAPEVIAPLKTDAQSAVRPPSVYLFNPFAEGYLAHGPSFTPVKAQAQLARDLANLPQFLCRQEDIVLVPQRPSAQFLRGVQQAGFILPEFVADDPCLPGAGAGPSVAKGTTSRSGGISSLVGRELGGLRPWAWGPDSVELLQPLFGGAKAERRTASQRFNAAIAQLYSKAWSAAFLRRVLQQHSHERGMESATGPAPDSWLCTEGEVGVVVDTLDAALEAIATIRQRGHHRIVAKQALGLAGQNAIRLWEPELLEAHRRWLANALHAGRQLVIEPWLERELDFSVQLEMGANRLELCGYTGLLTDLRGQYQGNWAEAHHHQCLPDRTAALLRQSPDLTSRALRLYRDIGTALQGELQRAGYVGPVGVDAFVYREPGGHCRLKPIVEINPRYTMGRVLVELMKQTCPGSCGLLRLVSRTMAQAEGQVDFVAYARALHERFPLRLEGEPVARMREGAFCLNDPDQAQTTLAVFHVSRQLEALPRFRT